MPSPKHLAVGWRPVALAGAAIAIIAALLCAWGWSGAFGGASDSDEPAAPDAQEREWPSSGLIAATVGGVEISEDAVTEEIVELRESMGLETPESWNAFLDAMGYEPETLREQVITRRVNEELVAEECAARGLDLSDAELDAAVGEEKTSFESPEAWNAYLENYGMDEAAFRESLRARLLSERLQGALVAESTEGWDELSEAEREQATLGGADVLNEWLSERWDEGDVSVQTMPDTVPYGRES